MSCRLGIVTWGSIIPTERVSPQLEGHEGDAVACRGLADQVSFRAQHLIYIYVWPCAPVMRVSMAFIYLYCTNLNYTYIYIRCSQHREMCLGYLNSSSVQCVLAPGYALRRHYIDGLQCSRAELLRSGLQDPFDRNNVGIIVRIALQ